MKKTFRAIPAAMYANISPMARIIILLRCWIIMNEAIAICIEMIT